MKKKELAARIAALEAQVASLQAQLAARPYVYPAQPYPYITFTTPCSSGDPAATAREVARRVGSAGVA